MLTLKFHCPCNGNEISVLAYCRVDHKSFEEKTIFAVINDLYRE